MEELRCHHGQTRWASEVSLRSQCGMFQCVQDPSPKTQSFTSKQVVFLYDHLQNEVKSRPVE